MKYDNIVYIGSIALLVVVSAFIVIYIERKDIAGIILSCNTWWVIIEWLNIQFKYNKSSSLNKTEPFN